VAVFRHARTCELGPRQRVSAMVRRSRGAKPAIVANRDGRVVGLEVPAERERERVGRRAMSAKMLKALLGFRDARLAPGGHPPERSVQVLVQTTRGADA